MTSVPLYHLDNQIFGVLCKYEDITERKRAEEAITRSNTALSEFAHVVAHDLESPLRTAKNYTQLLERKSAGQLDARAHEYLHFVEESLDRMRELIRSLLSYATANQSETSEKQITLESALIRALANLQLLIEETHAVVTYEELPAIVAGPIQIVQIFQNLISNAIKYRKPNTVPRISVSVKDSGEEWIVSVRDNGIGIAPEYYERIFTPMKRLHGRDIPGFGIGLATCRRVAEFHGGRIWVESQPGVGSAFHFTVRKNQQDLAEDVIRQDSFGGIGRVKSAQAGP
jgi:light-regulated signal transduction histidine kinase (bacteriophytochrome)